MDRRERNYDDEETTRAAIEGKVSRLWTAMPGIVHAVNNAQGANSMTVDVQPSINGRVRLEDGTYIWVQLPTLVDCPIVFQGGGGVTLTFPVQAGDEALVILASRCIDGWWRSGAVTNPPVLRMHSLSDGFALVGVRSKPRAYAIPSTGARLTADDGSTYIELQPGPQLVKVVAPGGINLNGVFIDATGNVSTPGNLSVGTGATGTYTTPTGQTVDVQDGITTNIF